TDTTQATMPITNAQSPFATAALGVVNHSVTVAYSGDGNFNASTSAALSQTVNQAGSVITFSSSADPSVLGQPVTFVATVGAVAPGAGTPTGTVTFAIDGVSQPTAPLNNGQATFTTSTLSVLNHT